MFCPSAIFLKKPLTKTAKKIKVIDMNRPRGNDTKFIRIVSKRGRFIDNSSIAPCVSHNAARGFFYAILPDIKERHDRLVESAFWHFADLKLDNAFRGYVPVEGTVTCESAIFFKGVK